MRLFFIFLISIVFNSAAWCQVKSQHQVVTGAERLMGDLSQYDLKNKTVAVIANHTSVVCGTHLVDTLLKAGINVKKVFAPEHGFRGKADAGEKIADDKDIKTGLPIISLYGKKKKPNAADLEGIDVLLFDIQDVGVRFYTYIYTMTYCMEAAADNSIDFIVLDRPNPLGFAIDGPVLKEQYSSFVGLHPTPLLHGCTVGEYAKMVAGENWLKTDKQPSLSVVPCQNWTHDDLYQLPIPPSPNLPNMNSIYQYPSLGLFEGTAVSVGRGTKQPFQLYGHPMMDGSFQFVPKTNFGAKYPKLKGQTCNGSLLDTSALGIPQKLFTLKYLINAHQQLAAKTTFFLSNNFFYNLSGTNKLRQQIEAEMSEKEIRASWAEDLTNYQKIREKYLLYK